MISLLQYLINLKKSEKDSENLIRSGKVLVNDEVVFIPSVKIDPQSKVLIKEKSKWVSRGALKLLPFAEEMEIKFQNKVVLDIGSSTGGFTQVALKKGAQKIYALDVGTNQLDFSLRRNPKVISIEKTNLKNIKEEMFDQKIDIVLSDVSFISLRQVFKVINNEFRNQNLKLITLIKPQFEANSNQVTKGGFVPLELHEEILLKVENFAKDNNFTLIKLTKSKVKGKKNKNQEYLALFEKRE